MDIFVESLAKYLEMEHILNIKSVVKNNINNIIFTPYNRVQNFQRYYY